MNLTYYPGFSPLHSMDARAKLFFLLIYSVGIFFLGNSEVGLALLAGATLLPFLLAAVAKIPWRALILPLVPVLVVALITILALGWPTFEQQDIEKGLCAAARIIGLAAISMVVAYTTTSRALLQAFTWVLSPLRIFGVPVDSIAFTLGLAVHFIPLVAEEYERVSIAARLRFHPAPRSHSVPFNLSGRIKRYLAPFRVAAIAFVAVFIGLFRRADTMAQAMDARCFAARNEDKFR